MNYQQKCIDLLNKSLIPLPQELNELDWKEEISPNHDKLAKHLSAFSNYMLGGFLVFGVKDQGEVVGIKQEEVKNITDTLGNISRVWLEPQVSLEYFTFEYSGQSLLGVYIQEAVQKPVYIKKRGLEASFIRAGGQSRSMSQNEIRAAILSSRVQRYEELPAILPNDKQDNWKDLFDFKEIIKRTPRLATSGEEALYEYLFQCKLLLKTRGEYRPTNLCVLMCAKDFASLPGYEKFGIRITEYSGADKISSRRDFFLNTGYSLSLDEVVERIVSILPHNEIIERATRINDPVIPEIAIRELVANAIVHRDYSQNSSFITINIFSDRIEITNPGGLLPDISVDRLIDHPSKTRNEVLADLMRKLRFVEEEGTGYDKVVTAIEFKGLPPVKWRQERDYFCAILYMPKQYNDMDRAERIEAVFQHACLNFVENKKTTNHSIRKRFKFDNEESTKVTRLIKECIKENRVRCANKEDTIKKNWHYVPYWAFN